MGIIVDNKIKLWLDDYRPCPFIGNWKVALNYDEAIEILTNHNPNTVEECWLDHDLAADHYVTNMDVDYVSPNKTGMDVLNWMIRNNKMPLNEKIRVHSLNPSGSKRMAEAIAGYYGYPIEYSYSKFLYSYLLIRKQLETDFDEGSNLRIGKDY